MNISVSQSGLSWQAADVMVQAAVKHAQSIGVKVNIAVVDSGGHLLAFARMNGAFLHSIDIAQDKAYSAVSFAMPTSRWYEIFAEVPQLKDGLLSRDRFVALGGGIPVRQDDQIIGGIGVSGASEEQDSACAQAGIDAVMP